MLGRHIRATLCVTVSSASPSRSGCFESWFKTRDCDTVPLRLVSALLDVLSRWTASPLHFGKRPSSTACLSTTRCRTPTWAQCCSLLWRCARRTGSSCAALVSTLSEQLCHHILAGALRAARRPAVPQMLLTTGISFYLHFVRLSGRRPYALDLSTC